MHEVLYPGMDWQGGIINTLIRPLAAKKNPNDHDDANKASKTALTWLSICSKSQYDNMWSTIRQRILFTICEVRLSYAEEENELTSV